jgi:Leu/Phe-tRNA-protein transferase
MHLREKGFQLFDIQMVTPATEQLGAREITRGEYLRRLRAALKIETSFR